MTSKAALCVHLLRGETLNIKNVFSQIGLTNCPREISRMIEKPFGVNVTRTHREGKSRYGQAVVWVDYKLEKTNENLEGIEKMKEYVNSQKTNPKTDKETKHLKSVSAVQEYNNAENEAFFEKYQNEKPDPITVQPRLF